MDGAAGQRDPTGSRAPSRTSTASSHSHRHHHAHCSPTKAAAPQLSSLLQERLQQRRAEKKMSEGSLSTSTGHTHNSDNVIRSSPIRGSSTAMVQRAQSDSIEDGVNNMGVKEIEKTIATLKKQNWDLKLEMYHRRERQSALEKQVKIVQEENKNMLAQQTETMKLSEDLARELDRRDKALFEAIDMIMDLQSRVDELEREKEIVRIVEADLQHSSVRSQVDQATARTAAEAPNLAWIPPTAGFPGHIGDTKTLERMSSFLTEHGDRTANLRDMILNNKSSFFHLRKVSDASAVPSEINHITSPSLSVLSESSFMSVYGNNQTTPEKRSAPSELVEPDSLDRPRNLEPGKKLSSESPSSRKSGNAMGFTPRRISGGGASLSAQMQSLNNIRNISSPLQQIERLERRLSGEIASRLSTSSQFRANIPMVERAASQSRAKREKRETLRRVMTSSPDANDLDHARMLPPTPDTTSSSMLRRCQNSNDTLSREPMVTLQDSFVTDAQKALGMTLPPQLSPKIARGRFSQLAPVPVVISRNDLLGPPLSTQTFGDLSLIPQTSSRRPHSVDETTISAHRVNNWESDSDSDSDGGADAQSEASEIDYWMHESTKPNSDVTIYRDDSPDLFSFPAESGRWETDAMFGALRGTGFLGSPPPDLKRDPMVGLPGSLILPQNDLYQALDPEAPDGGIDAPARRSSRSARTGSRGGNSISSELGKPNKYLARGDSAAHIKAQARRNSIDTADARPQVQAQVDYQTDGAGVARRGQYPPIAGQATRQKKSGALNRLFRRSIGSSRDMLGMTSSPTGHQKFPGEQTQSVHPQIRRDLPTGRSSVPPPATMPWRPPPAVRGDDLMSATPPPIKRKRASPTELNMDGGGDAPFTPRHVNSGGDYQDEAAQTGSASNTPQSGRRKWLGLGRRSSLRNRTFENCC